MIVFIFLPKLRSNNEPLSKGIVLDKGLDTCGTQIKYSPFEHLIGLYQNTIWCQNETL